MDLDSVVISKLKVSYWKAGPSDGVPVVLLHGFPYDPTAYHAVMPALADQGFRVFAPYLRGYGPTEFLRASDLRSGQQAALATDLLEFLDATSIERAVLVGYDWGGRAACIVSALYPERVIGLISGTGYNLQDIAQSGVPASPQAEAKYWYQYYFHTPRGAAGLAQNRDELCRLLWKLWSPNWAFDEATFSAAADSFQNPDFVEVVLHSYRHRFGYADGDPDYAGMEAKLLEQPDITVPTITVYGLDDGVHDNGTDAAERAKFTGPYQRIDLAGTGHNFPQEAPDRTVRMVSDLLRLASDGQV